MKYMPARVSLLLRIVLLALVVGIALTPSLAQAAPLFQDGSNPFADAGARTWAKDLINDMIFWVWIIMAFGFLIWVVAYFAQPAIPNFYNQMRDYLRNGILIALAFQVLLNIILAQADSAGGGSEGSAPPPQHVAALVIRIS